MESKSAQGTVKFAGRQRRQEFIVTLLRVNFRTPQPHFTAGGHKTPVSEFSEFTESPSPYRHPLHETGRRGIDSEGCLHHRSCVRTGVRRCASHSGLNALATKTEGVRASITSVGRFRPSACPSKKNREHATHSVPVATTVIPGGVFSPVLASTMGKVVL